MDGRRLAFEEAPAGAAGEAAEQEVGEQADRADQEGQQPSRGSGEVVQADALRVARLQAPTKRSKTR